MINMSICRDINRALALAVLVTLLDPGSDLDGRPAMPSETLIVSLTTSRHMSGQYLITDITSFLIRNYCTI